MSGHSKWATIKHKKGAVDRARGKLFNKLARQLEVTARAGGGDPDVNPTLRTAVQKAKAAQMTNDAIDRAIKRGTGEGDAGTYESIMYEGYAPGGVALLIDVLTDNRNRTGSEVRGVFTRHGGSLAEPGSVSWQFGRRGVIMIDGAATEDDVMLAALDAGADDVADDGGTWRITTDASTVYDVRDALTSAGLTVLSADAPMVSDNVVPITSVEEAKRVLRVVEALEDNDDVQDVFANFDIADEMMTEVLSSCSVGGVTAAAIYCRISKDDAGTALGVARQERLCRELAEARELDVVDVFVDNDISAYNGKKRPGLEALLGAVESGRVQAVLCYHVDRLYRRAIELEALVALVERTRARGAHRCRWRPRPPHRIGTDGRPHPLQRRPGRRRPHERKAQSQVRRPGPRREATWRTPPVRLPPGLHRQRRRSEMGAAHG